MVTCSIVLGYMSVLIYVHLKRLISHLASLSLIPRNTLSHHEKGCDVCASQLGLRIQKTQKYTTVFLSGPVSNSFRLTNDVSSFYPPRINDKHHRKKQRKTSQKNKKEKNHRKTRKKNITEKQERKTSQKNKKEKDSTKRIRLKWCKYNNSECRVHIL